MLGTVQMCGEKLSQVEAGDICKSLDSNNIRLLSLRDCKVKDQDFRSLMNSLGRCKSIIQLNLNLGLVSNLGRVTCLSESLQKNRALTSLFLHGSPLGDRGAAVLCRGLALHPNVVNLDLGDCLLTDGAIADITDLLPPNGAKRGLVELTLSANPGITTQGWTKLFIGLAASSSLKILNLDYNTIGDYGAGCLAVTLAANDTLETLDLEGAGISEFGAQAFLYLVRNYPVGIKKLILNENKVKPSTVQAIEACVAESTGSTASESTGQPSDLNSTGGSEAESASGTPRALGASTHYWSVSGGSHSNTMAWATPSQTLSSTYTLEKISPQQLRSGTERALARQQQQAARQRAAQQESESEEDEEETDTDDTESEVTTGPTPRKVHGGGHVSPVKQGSSYTQPSNTYQGRVRSYPLHDAYRTALADNEQAD